MGTIVDTSKETEILHLDMKNGAGASNKTQKSESKAGVSE